MRSLQLKMGAESVSHKPQNQSFEVVAGRYELRQHLARGGMGEVFAAHDRSTGRAVALKRLLASAQAQRGLVAYFMREYHALSELRHPRIIEVYEYGVDRSVPYYTMELLDGHDLRELSPLPFREACLYLRDVASSLALLHARRLMHRDVSPRNVRRTSDGHCKLLDFGAMIPFGVPPNITGTAPCVPPEALHGTALDQRADLYSLGSVAYYVLTGRPAYAVTRLEELRAAWATPVQRPKRFVDIPDELDELVMSLLSLDPRKRPNSAAEVIDWLSAIGQLAPDDAPAVARAFFTSAPLCGRVQQVEQLKQRIQRTSRGKGGAMILEGGSGSGKSRILTEAGLIAQTCGVTALQAIARGRRGASYALAYELIAAAQQLMPLEAEKAGAGKIAWPRAHDHSAERDPIEQRARLQQDLRDVLMRLARERPVLIAIDDLERVDEPSAALIAALAYEAAHVSLLIVAAYTSDATESAPEVAALRGFADTIRVGDLSREQTQELVRSMFGNAPNTELLGEWLYRVAAGNPKLTFELAEHLFKHGLLRYADGIWVVPSEEITLEVPADLSQTWALRVQALTPAALEFADLLTLRRGGSSIELCVAASGCTPELTFAMLDELVRAGVLESAGADYVFAQQALRKSLEQRLSPERLRALHARWAKVLLEDAGDDLDLRLEGGWHLIHTDAELRGAEILTEIAPIYVDRAISMGLAIPALEKALEVYERRDRPLAARLRLRSALVLAGYLYDYRLAFRYGEDTLALLHKVSGMALASRLGRFVGKSIAFILALLAVSIRRLWIAKARRGPPAYTALRYFVRSAMGMLGVRATSLDAAGAASIVRLLEPLAGAPGMASGRMIYLSCKALGAGLLGREAEHKHAMDEALRAVRSDRRSDMSEVEYRALLAGLLMSDGLNESSRENSQALERVTMLESLGTTIAYTGALRIRAIYYARRGDMERAEHYRRLVTLHAIQGGTMWQGEWFSVPNEGGAGAAWSDLVMLRRSLDRLAQLVVEVPALRTLYEGLRIAYHYCRGEHVHAVELGAAYVASHPPRSVTGWAGTYGVIALSYIEVGDARGARALCEAALAEVTSEDLSYFLLYVTLEVAYAIALALTGEAERGRALMRKRIERLQQLHEHASLVLLYKHQARMAQLLDDRALLIESLQSMRESALACGLPAVIVLANRVAELRARSRSSPLPPQSKPLDSAWPGARVVPVRTEDSAMTAFLRRVPSGHKRIRDALSLLARYLDCEEAHLFRLPGFEVIASVPEDREVPGLVPALAEHEPFVLSSTGVRYRVLAFKVAEVTLALAALRDGPDSSSDVPAEMIAELSRLLAEDFVSEG